jgi:site-specific recombinase XerD
MLENYFCAPKTLRRLRVGLSGPYIDGFADALELDRYANASAIRYLRAAAHFGCFVHRRGGVLADVDARTLDAFGRHFPRCRCSQSNGGTTGYHARFGVKLFHQHLVQVGICRSHSVADVRGDEPAIVIAFRDWMRVHRGASDPTLRLYSRDANEFIKALGEDVGKWTVRDVRDFVLDRTGKCGAPTTQKRVTSLRAFLRYLNFTGESPDDLALAVPAIAGWRLARLPCCLSEGELVRVIAACDGTTPGRLRDRAILLLLSRLGLRAGDVAQLCLSEIDWNNGTLQVTGKGRYQVRLPLPQEVGNALLRYLDCRPKVGNADRVFLRSIAPATPFASTDAVAATFESIAREWFALNSRKWAPSHGDRIIRRLELNIFPWLGTRPIAEIKASELLTTLRRIEGRGAHETAHRALQNCARVFRYAVVTDRADRDIARDLAGALAQSLNSTTRASLILVALELCSGRSRAIKARL